MLVINKITIIRIVLLALIISTVVFIWSNSLLDSESSSAVSDNVVEKVKPLIDPQDKINNETFTTLIRKMAHFAEFTLLGAEIMLLCLTFGKALTPVFPRILIPIGAGFLCAVTDELLQLTSPGRSCEFRDMMIDLGGVVLGMLAIICISHTIAHFKNIKARRS